MIDENDFKSIFKNEFIDFVEYKRLCGYKYSKETYSKFRRLDKFFLNQKLNKKEITIELIEKWINNNNDTSIANKNSKYRIITMFCNYLKRKGFQNIAILPDNPYFCKSKFIPYIFSKDEIIMILINLKNKINNRNGLLAYTAINIIYCCGLRKSELLNLKLKDLNIENKTITIYKSKNDVTRLIPLSPSLFKLLNNYINKNIYISNENFIFLNNITRDRVYRIILYYYKSALIQANIPKNYNDKLPRSHDLRHTFAIHTLDNMLNKGYKLYQCLPTLSVYLGHKSVYETEYYLKLAEIHFKDLTDKVLEYTSDIYVEKEFIYDEK